MKINAFPRQFLPLTAIVFSLTLSAQAQSFLTNGLVAYYTFSGNANDVTGHGHNGVVMGATLTTNRFGQANSAYAFNGSNSMIIVSNSDDLQPLGDFSVSVWMKVPKAPDDSDALNRYGMLLTKHFGGANNSGWTMEVVPPNDVTPPSTGLPLTFQAAPQFNGSTPQMNIPTDTWFQAVFTYQRSSGACNFYLNGVLADSRIQDFNDNNDPDPFIIGALPTPNYVSASGYQFHFNGLLDDVRIYNRVLQTNEVQQLYALESGAYVTPVVDAGMAIHLEFSQLVVGLTYQLQISHNRRNWVDVGTPFTATSPTQSKYLDTGDVNIHSLSWRLQVAP